MSIASKQVSHQLDTNVLFEMMELKDGLKAINEKFEAQRLKVGTMQVFDYTKFEAQRSEFPIERSKVFKKTFVVLLLLWR